MSVNINYLFTRVTVFALTIVLPTVLTTVKTSIPSKTRNCKIIDERINSGHYYNVTANGNSKGAPCVFPFFYNGSYHHDCVSFDRPNPWCSTTDNYTRDGQWGECLNYDVCQGHSTLSDPWRNIAFGSLLVWKMLDLNLQEGWYRFNGTGGDQMAYYCLSKPGFNYSSISVNLTWNSCDPVNGSAQNLDCGAGLILYYLIPIRGAYRTSHSSCNASSCGTNVACNNSDGGCACDSDKYLMLHDEYYTCIARSNKIGYTFMDLQNIQNNHHKENTNGNNVVVVLPVVSTILHNTTEVQLSSPFNVIQQNPSYGYQVTQPQVRPLQDSSTTTPNVPKPVEWS
ncbi:uncharacterized protein LOC119264671 [Pygocentrus nattereri]|uniref:uncharacterized protein LOC119264671 n=1 Tax=Pygocentrus nattereri TaxID=42514 RepID=UPI001890DDD0|nr:uncharacterized protein LOC119264671 [Pygocentrus nattereri]